jgi:hypothetical protein
MNYRKFNRRVRSVRWAYGVLDHAVDVRRAQRAAALIGALENWLDNNATLDLATYNDHE